MDDKAPQTYETSLEAVGSYLDAQGATEFKLIETPEGFLVRYERKGRSEGVMVMFRFGDLRRTALDIDVFHKVRHPLDDRQYRKLLRAIGHPVTWMGFCTSCLTSFTTRTDLGLAVTHRCEGEGTGSWGVTG